MAFSYSIFCASHVSWANIIDLLTLVVMASPLVQLMIFFTVMFGVPLFQVIVTVLCLLMITLVWVGSTFFVTALQLSLQSPTSSWRLSLNIPLHLRLFVLIMLSSLSKPLFIHFALIVALSTRLLVLTPCRKMVLLSKNIINSLISLAHYWLRCMFPLTFSLTPSWVPHISKNWLPSTPLGGAIPLHGLLPTSPFFSLPPRLFGCTTFFHDHFASLSKLSPHALKGLFLATPWHKKATRYTLPTPVIMWLLSMSPSMRTLPFYPLLCFLQLLLMHLLCLVSLPSWSFLIPSLWFPLLPTSSLLSFSSCLLGSSYFLCSRYRSIVPLDKSEILNALCRCICVQT